MYFLDLVEYLGVNAKNKTMNSKFAKLNEGVKKERIKEIEEIEEIHKIKIPSDYVNFLAITDGVSFKNSYSISVDKKTPIVEIDDLLSLEWFINEIEYDKEDDYGLLYNDRFYKIASTLSQDRVLIGFGSDVLNQIFLFDGDEEKLIRISDSLDEFISDYLITNPDY